MPTDAFAITIGDETVSKSKTTIQRMGMDGVSVSTTSFLHAIRNDLMPQSGLLPPNIRWISRSRKIWLFEYPPMDITIKYSIGLLEEISDETDVELYTIHLPWTAYLVDLDQTYYPEFIFVFALEKPIESFNDRVGILPLSNFSSGGKLCQPHRGEVNEQPMNVAQGLNLAFRLVWSSGFNMDLDSNFYWCRGLLQPTLLFPSDRMVTPRSVTTTWAALTDTQVESITDWAGPHNNDRFTIVENMDGLFAHGRQIYERKRSKGGRGFECSLERPLTEATKVDGLRRGDWAAQGLQNAFQTAVAQAGLYED